MSTERDQFTVVLESIRDNFRVFGEGQIVLQQGLNDLRVTVGDIQSKLGIVQTDVAILKDDVAVLKTDVAVLKTDVHDLKTRMTRVEKHLHLNGAGPARKKAAASSKKRGT